MRKFLFACLLFSIVSLISTNETCDCSYRSKTWYGGGGCIITKAAPRFSACKCSYAAWGCSGEVVPCPSSQFGLGFNFAESSHFCNNPDTTKKSCEQGGGDCDGY